MGICISNENDINNDAILYNIKFDYSPYKGYVCSQIEEHNGENTRFLYQQEGDNTKIYPDVLEYVDLSNEGH